MVCMQTVKVTARRRAQHFPAVWITSCLIKGMWAVKLCSNRNPRVLNCHLTQVDLYNGHKMVVCVRVWYIIPTHITITTILWTLKRTTGISQHLQLRTRGFSWRKVLLQACPWWYQLVHLDNGEDGTVLFNGVTCTISIPSNNSNKNAFNLMHPPAVDLDGPDACNGYFAVNIKSWSSVQVHFGVSNFTR